MKSLSNDKAFMDFETYSEAGYVWNETAGKWESSIAGSIKRGIVISGTPVYSEHPSCEVLCLAYKLPQADWKLWAPGGLPGPTDLFDYITSGGIIEAWNSIFEYFIWENVCYARMGWPRLPIGQLRDTMALAKSWSLPGALKNAAKVLQATDQKDKKGESLIRKLCCPRKPTKKQPVKRLLPRHDPAAFSDLYDYCIQDIKAEASVAQYLPELSPYEEQLFLLDQDINVRGVYIDQNALNDCIIVFEQARDKYTAELSAITGGTVSSASEVANIRTWLSTRGYYVPDLQADTVKSFMEQDLPEDIEKVLNIRIMLSSNSVKKLYSIRERLTRDGRLKTLFQFCGADRTGRWAGRGPQPQNLPSSGPAVFKCETCGRIYSSYLKQCPKCLAYVDNPVDWGVDAVGQALEDISTHHLQHIENIWGNPIKTISGCLRGLFSAAPGHDLICSDYSAIEAVVAAFVAEEPWRMEVFRTHGKIYEMCASTITGVPFEEMLDYKKTHGHHHPYRKQFGKIPELASGYGGALGAWKAFGADEFMTDDEITLNVKKWRKASPHITNYWWGLGDAALAAVKDPGKWYEFKTVAYASIRGVLYCKLPSGRYLNYHNVSIGQNRFGNEAITYEGWNSDYKKGPIGWITIDTYGPKLFENIVQALSRDILGYAMLHLDHRGYPIVLHVHDEIVAEVPQGQGSIEEFEQIMSTMPDWCKDWPVKAAGGWRGQRYRKD